MDYFKGRTFHFIGIGGIHMSGLAEMCKRFGASVTGSDAGRSENTDRLVKLGIPVTIGHSPDNINEFTDQIVYTSAVKPDNPEFAMAKKINLAIMDRAALLGMLMEHYTNRICVSGVHGKTSTTAMIAETLYGMAKNPTIINGGICTRINAAMRMGGTEYFVAEADEYYDAFLKYKPSIGIILNIDHDHSDYFPTFDALWQSFRRFAKRVDKDGTLIIHGEIPKHAELTRGLHCRVITYGTQDSDWTIRDEGYDKRGMPLFNAAFGNQYMGRVALSVPGRHNMENALAALAACHALGLDASEVIPQLAQFKGAARRFQHKEEYKGANIYDDYAHHPVEVKKTLEAAKRISRGKRVICVFQPHTRSRTKELISDFAQAFTNANKVILLPVFTPAGREESHIDIGSDDLCKHLLLRGEDAVVRHSFEEAAHTIRTLCRPGDVVMLMGAGDIYKMRINQ